MKKLIQICFMLCAASTAFAQDDQQTRANAQTPEKVLRVYDWKDLMSQHPFPNSEIVSMDGISVLKIDNTNSIPANYDFKSSRDFPPLDLNTNDTSLEISLLKITNSSVIEETRSISFEMKYENVVDKWFPMRDGGMTTKPANLTLLNYFPPSAPGGDERMVQTGSAVYPEVSGAFDVGNIVGTANWKQYRVGVDRVNGSPERLELKLFLPGHGTVYLRQLKLVGIKTNWWSPQMGGLVGGIGGSALGCLAGLLGCLAGMGKARGFVLAMVKIFIGLGILMAIAGIVAIASSQPYAVWYPLVLMGGILTFVFSVNLYPVKKRYDDLEIRRMTSMDVTGR